MGYRWLLLALLLLTVLFFMAFAGISAETVLAFNDLSNEKNVVQGAALYDNWMAVLGTTAPPGNMPIWSRQSTNTRSGADTWRCVTCHGWDYQGKDGAYRSGSNYTGFPGVFKIAQTKNSEEIRRQLTGQRDPAHNFSKYLKQQDITDIIEFLTTALIDDTEYIDPITLQVIGGDVTHGKELFTQQCTSCHGEEGSKIQFRFEGINATLGTLATQDPWRFLHKTRFGTPGTPMVIGYTLGWTPQDGRDVLLYVQSLPSGLTEPTLVPALQEHPKTQPTPSGSPASNIWTGILTALAAMAAGLGFNILVAAALVGIILLLVWIARSRK